MENTYYRIGSSLGVMSGILYAVSFSLQYGITVEVLSFLGGLFLTLWLATIYLYQIDSVKWLGRAGFVSLVLAGLFLIFLNYMIFFAWKFDYATIEAQLKTPIIYLFLVTEPLYAWTIMALGVSSLENGKLPRGSTILWLVGILLFMVMPSYVTIAAASVGIVWSGIAMWNGRDDSKDKEVGLDESIQTKNIEDSDNHAPRESSTRLFSLDTLRGLIIALMAIDHTSLLVRKAHSFELFELPIPTYESSAAFLTRFVTHICAPGFFFLMGAGMILLAESRRKHGWSNWQIARHFLVRGMLLIVLEQLLLDPVLYQTIMWKEYGVLFGLGGAMIVGILFLRLGTLPLFGIGTGLILITQILPDAMNSLGLGHLPAVRMFLVPGQAGDWFTIYPVLPWLGIAALGMAFGRELLKDRQQAYRKALIAGLVFMGLFVVVRSFGEFGNFIPTVDAGWIAFLNMVKYPPSLGFILLTLGIDLLLIVLFAKLGERLKKWGQPLLTFGGTALFFYFMHWFMLNQLASFFPEGTGLPIMYVCWALVLVLLYPICRSYLRFKRETVPESFWRLF
jgi:uncharacterized membrane protein